MVLTYTENLNFTSYPGVIRRKRVIFPGVFNKL